MHQRCRTLKDRFLWQTTRLLPAHPGPLPAHHAEIVRPRLLCRVSLQVVRRVLRLPCFSPYSSRGQLNLSSSQSILKVTPHKSPKSRAKRRMQFAGKVISAEVGIPFHGGPAAVKPPPLPCTLGLTKLS